VIPDDRLRLTVRVTLVGQDCDSVEGATIDATVAALVFRPKLLESHGFDLARKLNMAPGVSGNGRTTGSSSKMSHLENIATRQRKSLVRDALFATLVAIAAIVSVSTVTQAVAASCVVAHR
jgi:hypothetical protein